jgi:hypothetical protein
MMLALSIYLCEVIVYVARHCVFFKLKLLSIRFKLFIALYLNMNNSPIAIEFTKQDYLAMEEIMRRGIKEVENDSLSLSRPFASSASISFFNMFQGVYANIK